MKSLEDLDIGRAVDAVIADDLMRRLSGIA